MRPAPLKNERGFATFIALLVLTLGTSFALMAFQSSTTELAIARNAEDSTSAEMLAESGVAQVIGWAFRPDASPDENFFKDLTNRNCSGTFAEPDFLLSPEYLVAPESPFSELAELGQITDLRLFGPTHALKGICTIDVSAKTVRGALARVQVNVTAAPLGPITAAIQGRGYPADAENPNSLGLTDVPAPLWAHWGQIRYTGGANLGAEINKVPIKDVSAFPDGDAYFSDVLQYDQNIDPIITLLVENEISAPLPGPPYVSRPHVMQNMGSDAALDALDFDALKSFIKKHGDYLTVSEAEGYDDGQHLLRNGQPISDGEGGYIESFDALFEAEMSEYHLVWIDNAGLPAMALRGERYRGYFFFSGDVFIEGNHFGETVIAVSPEVGGSIPRAAYLTDINLEGLLVTRGSIEMAERFSVYGAVYSEGGFKGEGATDLEVWFNSYFTAPLFLGVRPVTPLPGTWRTCRLVDPDSTSVSKYDCIPPSS